MDTTEPAKIIPDIRRILENIASFLENAFSINVYSELLSLDNFDSFE